MLRTIDDPNQTFFGVGNKADRNSRLELSGNNFELQFITQFQHFIPGVDPHQAVNPVFLRFEMLIPENGGSIAELVQRVPINMIMDIKAEGVRSLKSIIQSLFRAEFETLFMDPESMHQNRLLPLESRKGLPC